MEVRINGIRYVPMLTLPESPGRLSEVLRSHREHARLSLDEASLKADISKTYLWELETGKATDPSYAIVVRLARLYGVSLESLAVTVPGGVP